MNDLKAKNAATKPITMTNARVSSEKPLTLASIDQQKGRTGRSGNMMSDRENKAARNSGRLAMGQVAESAPAHQYKKFIKGTNVEKLPDGIIRQNKIISPTWRNVHDGKVK